MDELILVKFPNGVEKRLGKKAAETAINALNAIEVKPPVKPKEIGTKTKPPEITTPIILKPAESKDLPEILPDEPEPIVNEPVKEIKPVVKRTRKPKAK